VQLAREIASAKPAYISQGWGPQRHANGEMATRDFHAGDLDRQRRDQRRQYRRA
jgi:hypothetical protein